jgi:hypothetical protein
MSSKMQLILWVAHPAMESVLAAIMVKRKLHKQFPVFFTYILWQIVNFLILFPLYKKGAGWYDVYFYVYWLGTAVSLGLGFKVIHEIVLSVFQPYHALKDLSTILFRWAALVMLLVALVVAASNAGANVSPITQAVVTGQRCVRVVQCGLILFLLVFSKYLGISWKQHSLGIALGFGGYATIELGAFALFAGGQIRTPTVGAIEAATYTLAICVWIGYAVLRAPEREDATKLLTSQRWEQSLAEIQAPVSGQDSLIPMFESMVERAFSRAPNGEETLEEEVLTVNRVEKLATPVSKD